MKISFTTPPRLRQPLGLGTAIKTAIHAGVAIAPLPAKTKQQIRQCAGCGRRAAKLDRAAPNINPLATKSPDPKS